VPVFTARGHHWGVSIVFHVTFGRDPLKKVAVHKEQRNKTDAHTDSTLYVRYISLTMVKLNNPS